MTDRTFTFKPLLGVAILIGFTLLAGFGSKLTGVGKTALPEAGVVQSVSLHFEDRSDGAVLVYRERPHASTHVLVHILEPGAHGFVRGVLRGLVRERKLHNIGSRFPFDLTRWSDGRLSLVDPETGRNIDLGAFGPTNAKVFAELLVASAASRSASSHLPDRDSEQARHESTTMKNIDRLIVNFDKPAA